MDTETAEVVPEVVPPIPPPPDDLIQRRYENWWPGKQGMDRAGNLSGCTNKVFLADDMRSDAWEHATDLMNKFFIEHPHLLSAEVKEIVGAHKVGYRVMYSKYVSQKESDNMNRVMGKVQEILEAEDAENAQAQAIQEEVQAKLIKDASEKADKDAREKNRLADLGRVHEKNCKKRDAA